MSSTEVDAFLAALPKDKRETLERLRKTLKAAVPEAEETITYGIPGFKYQGRPFVSYRASKDHCSFFVMSNITLKSFKDELKGYDTDTGTIRFPVRGTLPAGLVKKLVKARMAETDAAIVKKGKKK